MRPLFGSLLIAAAVPLCAQAAKDATAFSLIQNECVQVGDIRFGPGGRWPHCSVTKGRWFATIVADNLDFYQAQYCLGPQPGQCEARALLLFSNRAYTPVAKLLVARVDAAGTEYDDPQVMRNAYGYILVVSGRNGAGGSAATDFFQWQDRRWRPIEAQSWLRDLGKRVPRGTSVRAGASPNADTMVAQVPLYRKGDADCCPSGGEAQVELAVEKGRFVAKSMKVERKAAP